jgi:hypothetical protein
MHAAMSIEARRLFTIAFHKSRGSANENFIWQLNDFRENPEEVHSRTGDMLETLLHR